MIGFPTKKDEEAKKVSWPFFGKETEGLRMCFVSFFFGGCLFSLFFCLFF